MIKFDQVWSSLVHFGQIWSKKIKNKTAIFILSVNVTTFYSNIFRLVRNLIWSSLIHLRQIWSKKIKNKTVISILSVNVTTFYSNIFWLVRKPIWTTKFCLFTLIRSVQYGSNLIKLDQIGFLTNQKKFYKKLSHLQKG